MVLINGKAENRIDVLDRGLQYGDGLFETIAYRNNKLELFEQHLKRLQADAERIKLPLSDEDIDLLRNDVNYVTQSLSNDAVIKIIVTRGVGGRGYFAPNDLKPSRIVSTHPIPAYPTAFSTLGIKIRFCSHRLSLNTQLAGMKHLNRLDQVLARSEWSDKDIAEGLTFDQNENLIEGTMSNVFIVKSGQLITPKLEHCGVAGVMRAHLILLAENIGIKVSEQALSSDDLADADEVFVCNSVNGIWPVIEIVDINKKYLLGPVTTALKTALLKDEL